MKLTGKIVVKPFATGSKSDRLAVFLSTENGEYVLQEKNANPFESSKLEEMEGQTVIVDGELNDYLLLANEIIQTIS